MEHLRLFLDKHLLGKLQPLFHIIIVKEILVKYLKVKIGQIIKVQLYIQIDGLAYKIIIRFIKKNQNIQTFPQKKIIIIYYLLILISKEKKNIIHLNA